MGDTKPAQNASLPETHNPNPTPPAAIPPPAPPPPQPQTPAVPPHQNGSRKRPLDATIQIQDCTYFKMRAVVRDIRPHILEILRTADYRSSKGANELQEKLKLLVELCEQMKAGTVSVTKRKTISEEQPLSGDNGAAEQRKEQLQELAPEHGENQGKFIVGGSAFGWNFITFHGSKPIYYGRTKESFRSSQVTL